MSAAKIQIPPTPDVIAKQLRKPTGMLGKKVAEKMNESNGFLYTYALSQMDISDHDAVLEIGFGNGKFFSTIAKAAKDVTAYGLDFSGLMVKLATKNNAAAIKEKTLQLYHANSDAMPFADDHFNTIFCINVIYFWEHPSAHLKEVYRVLKPGGKFYTLIRTKESMLAMPFTPFGFTVYDKPEWTKLLKENGFGAVKTTAVKEPEIFTAGNNYALESLCIVAEK